MSNDAGWRWVRAVFIMATLAYGIIVPPFEVRDEPAHFAKAAQLAFWAFPDVTKAGQAGANLPAQYAQLIAEWPHVPVGQALRPASLSRVRQALTQAPAAEPQTAFVDFAYLGPYPPVLYAPQAIGIRLGTSIGLPPLLSFYAGRIVAGVVAVSLVLGAVALMPLGGRSMLVIAAMPGVSSPLASYSADSLIYALSFLTIAVLMRAAVSPRAWLQAAMLPLLVLLGLAKGVYLPIAAAGLAWPRAWQPRALAWLTLCCVLALGGFVLWFGVYKAGAVMPQHFVSASTHQQVESAGPASQMGFMRQHPATAAAVIVRTAVLRMPVYALDWVGRFGWLTLLLPLPLYALGAGVAAASTLETRASEPVPAWPARLMWLAIGVATILLVHIALYLTASSYGEALVDGVQGRYFIPVLPLLALAVRMRIGGSAAIWVERVLPWLTVALMLGAIIAVARAFWAV